MVHVFLSSQVKFWQILSTDHFYTQNFIINFELLYSVTFERKSRYLTFFHFCSEMKKFQKLELIQVRHKIKHLDNIKIRKNTVHLIYDRAFFVC